VALHRIGDLAAITSTTLLVDDPLLQGRLIVELKKASNLPSALEVCASLIS